MIYFFPVSPNWRAFMDLGHQWLIIYPATLISGDRCACVAIFASGLCFFNCPNLCWIGFGDHQTWELAAHHVLGWSHCVHEPWLYWHQRHSCAKQCFTKPVADLGWGKVHAYITVDDEITTCMHAAYRWTMPLRQVSWSLKKLKTSWMRLCVFDFPICCMDGMNSIAAHHR